MAARTTFTNIAPGTATYVPGAHALMAQGFLDPNRLWVPSASPEYVAPKSKSQVGQLVYAIGDYESGPGGGLRYGFLHGPRPTAAEATAYGAYGFTRGRLKDLGALRSVDDWEGLKRWFVNPKGQDHTMAVHVQEILGRMKRLDLAPQLDVGGRVAVEHLGGSRARHDFERSGGSAAVTDPHSKVTTRDYYLRFSGILPTAPNVAVVGADNVSPGGSHYIANDSTYPLGQLAWRIADRLSGGRGVKRDLRILGGGGAPVAFGAYAFTPARLQDLGYTVATIWGDAAAAAPTVKDAAFWQDHMMLVHLQDIVARLLDNDLAPLLDVGGRVAIEHWGGRGARLKFERRGGQGAEPLFPGAQLTDRALYDAFKGIVPHIVDARPPEATS